MTNDDLKKLKILFKDEIKPLKELIEITSHKVRQTDMSQTLMSSQLGRIKDQISVINEKLDDHSAKLDSHTAKLDNHTASLVSIEDTLKGYSDMYEVNKDKSVDLDERVAVIEDHLALSPKK